MVRVEITVDDAGKLSVSSTLGNNPDALIVFLERVKLGLLQAPVASPILAARAVPTGPLLRNGSGHS